MKSIKAVCASKFEYHNWLFSTQFSHYKKEKKNWTQSTNEYQTTRTKALLLYKLLYPSITAQVIQPFWSCVLNGWKAQIRGGRGASPCRADPPTIPTWCLTFEVLVWTELQLIASRKADLHCACANKVDGEDLNTTKSWLDSKSPTIFNKLAASTTLTTLNRT